jgi:methylthioribose-1-phosphate isomerase
MAAMNASSERHAVEALRWTGGALELLDQRKLPAQFTYVRCADAEEVAVAIRDMVVRGAPAIGCAAAYGVALAALRGSDLEEAIDVLARSRPTAVNLFWALDRMRRRLAAPWTPDALVVEAKTIHAEDIATNHAIGRAGAGLIRDGARVMTHCNAGALATTGHGTALGVVRSARDAGKRLTVLANETRPYLQGRGRISRERGLRPGKWCRKTFPSRSSPITCPAT